MSADDSSSADIFIYGDIVTYQWDEVDTSATSFKEDLDRLGDVSNLNLYINSPGGSVFEGIAIHNMLKRHKAKVNVYVDALAASIASVIAMAGDTIYMPKNSMLMIHHPWTFAWGNASEMRKIADDLDRIGNSSKQTYLQKAGDKLTDEKLQEMLDAETWLSADEAFAYGLCDVVQDANQIAASINDEIMNRYKNVPKQLVSQQKTPIFDQEKEKRQQIADDAKVNAAYINTILGGIFE
ncbi:ATP-dependent Clp protease proteolytic subunit [Paenibacillus phage HB10c2]|uniref:ATP-dependent Clp protease proteolytic subunit n=1 Tax=Paenibacillus phage HB10c2 TaxID=1589749 RepID=A0A0B5A796_9CAUD|nr:head maturation protease [Paenibacillus phage HB10c2]QVV19346.1 capsid maturation protease [Paenibacillus phage AlexiD]QVV19406.1 capsid maturation protease [Paenibacillus phage Bert]QVV19747.1 capsid maturation protease [Paenibacillus phage JackPlaque]QVV19879.1 capsid maturation protease [Paenibacillus phage Neutron]AJD83016.1 ATP-dependent Clp protease proteolytic subunit [Paenibacillus phage HB10c2]